MGQNSFVDAFLQGRRIKLAEEEREDEKKLLKARLAQFKMEEEQAELAQRVAAREEALQNLELISRFSGVPTGTTDPLRDEILSNAMLGIAPQQEIPEAGQPLSQPFEVPGGVREEGVSVNVPTPAGQSLMEQLLKLRETKEFQEKERFKSGLRQQEGAAASQRELGEIEARERAKAKFRAPAAPRQDPALTRIPTRDENGLPVWQLVDRQGNVIATFPRDPSNIKDPKNKELEALNREREALGLPPLSALPQ